MKWRKLGNVYCAKGESWWQATHAYLPTAHVFPDRIRVYVSFWDSADLQRVGYVDVNRDDPTHVLAVSKKPCLNIGKIGMFTEHGVTPSCTRQINKDLLVLYFIGWQKLGGSLPRYLFTGAAASVDSGENFVRLYDVPLMDRIHGEHFMRSAPWVIRDEKGFRCYYIASGELIDIHGHRVPKYGIRMLQSRHGGRWPEGAGHPCLNPVGDEFGLGRPCVIKRGDRYHMFYSIRRIDRGYRMGYAVSEDGRIWTRQDGDVGISLSSRGWDKGMVCFPNVVEIGDETYMFYNGNDYGRTGFGVAKLEGGLN